MNPAMRRRWMRSAIRGRVRHSITGPPGIQPEPPKRLEVLYGLDGHSVGWPERVRTLVVDASAFDGAGEVVTVTTVDEAVRLFGQGRIVDAVSHALFTTSEAVDVLVDRTWKAKE